MSFTNEQIALETLPRSADVQYEELDARYARIALGVALMIQIPVLLMVSGWLWVFLAPRAQLSGVTTGLLMVAILLLFILFAWFSFRSARVIRYALRQHDVILHSGVFWKKDAVQPIRRIQHIEQHQGPIDKRYGLYELKLFSAGTGNVTFRIPGLDADSAARIRQFILNVQEDGWGAAAAPESAGAESQPGAND